MSFRSIGFYLAICLKITLSLSQADDDLSMGRYASRVRPPSV